MAGEDIAAARKREELALGSATADERVQAQQRQRRRLAVRLGIDIGAQRRDAVGGRDDLAASAPRSACSRHSDRERDCTQAQPSPRRRRSRSRRAEPRYRASRRSAAPAATASTGIADLAGLALDIAFGLDHAAQRLRREVFAISVAPADRATPWPLTTYRALCGRNRTARARPAARRLAAAPAARAAPSRRCRDGRSAWRCARSA